LDPLGQCSVAAATTATAATTVAWSLGRVFGACAPGVVGIVDLEVAIVIDPIAAFRAAGRLIASTWIYAALVVWEVDLAVTVVVQTVVALVGSELARVGGRRTPGVFGVVDLGVAIVIGPIAALRRGR
jgi:hypothetical protein